ncbi:MAG: protein of unknown function DUF3383 [Myoviridae sp. ctThM1]|nr:MAG: protein of unknown function DUF3383 [Myoviridae sp. ctThM1]
MAEDLSDIIQITLTRESVAVSSASFEIPLILAEFTNFSERTRTYNNITDVEVDFNEGDPVHEMAEQLFGQSTVLGAVPPSIVVGRKQIDSVTLTPVVADNTVYTVTINDTPYTFTSDGTATAAEITAGLDTAIGTPTGITVTDNTGTLTVAPTVAGTPWSITVSSNLTKVDTPSAEPWTDALAAVEVENDTWYALFTPNQTSAVQDELAEAIRARRKIFGISSSDSAGPTTATTDIGAILSARNEGRTFGVWSATAATEYPEAVWAGSQLAVTPGSNDWDFKRGVGATRSALSPTQITNLKNKNWNYYIAKGGVDIFMNGNMFDGQPIDLVVGEDWLYARLQEAIYFRLINSLKIPMTNVGMTIIEGEIRSVLAQAEANGLIDTGWSVTAPDVLSIPANQRAQRIAGTFVFRARFAGSVRKVIIQGYLSV